jgi:hypothetical protein
MVPLFIDLVFTYLRRLPDLLVLACRPLLFEDWKSVSPKFKEWIDDKDRLDKHKPSCDFGILRDTIDNHSAWFNNLRATSRVTGKKGIRDAFEHRGTRLLVCKQQSGDERPQLTVIIDSRAEDVEVRKDILPRVPESAAGLCRLMSGIHSAIGIDGRYGWEDCLVLGGNNEDVTGYWPPIQT